MAAASGQSRALQAQPSHTTSGPKEAAGLLPTPTAQEIAAIHGKGKLPGYENVVVSGIMGHGAQQIRSKGRGEPEIPTGSGGWVRSQALTGGSWVELVGRAGLGVRRKPIGDP
ncbi:unnamed protein product [Linum trigynum]|uniref:Uncharacterized protein n=1 Tax=Linum trigynum TaxID=586398 RepID=A0AAV2DWU5_9ROSI